MMDLSKIIEQLGQSNRNVFDLTFGGSLPRFENGVVFTERHTTLMAPYSQKSHPLIEPILVAPDDFIHIDTQPSKRVKLNDYMIKAKIPESVAEFYNEPPVVAHINDPLNVYTNENSFTMKSSLFGQSQYQISHSLHNSRVPINAKALVTNDNRTNDDNIASETTIMSPNNIVESIPLVTEHSSNDTTESIIQENIQIPSSIPKETEASATITEVQTQSENYRSVPMSENSLNMTQMTMSPPTMTIVELESRTKQMTQDIDDIQQLNPVSPQVLMQTQPSSPSSMNIPLQHVEHTHQIQNSQMNETVSLTTTLTEAPTAIVESNLTDVRQITSARTQQTAKNHEGLSFGPPTAEMLQQRILEMRKKRTARMVGASYSSPLVSATSAAAATELSSSVDSNDNSIGNSIDSSIGSSVGSKSGSSRSNILSYTSKSTSSGAISTNAHSSSSTVNSRDILSNLMANLEQRRNVWLHSDNELSDDDGNGEIISDEWNK